MNHHFQTTTIEGVRARIRTALADATDEQVRAALQESLRILDTVGDRPQRELPSEYAGSIDFTFDDDTYEPNGRQIVVRVYYDWVDYNPADEPHPHWGATIQDMEVLAVRYFDQQGHELSANEHYADLAWNLLNQQEESVTEACTADGYRNAAGRSPELYSPPSAHSKTDPHTATEFASRLARSQPTRPPEERRGRQSG